MKVASSSSLGTFNSVGVSEIIGVAGLTAIAFSRNSTDVVSCNISGISVKRILQSP